MLVLRRASGGGTVYHDPGNLNISMAVPGWQPGLAGELAVLVAGAIGRLGLQASVGGHGVSIGPAKASGLASQVTRDGTLAHATLLMTTPGRPDPGIPHPGPAGPAPRGLAQKARPLCAHNPALDVTARLAGQRFVMMVVTGSPNRRSA